MGRGRAKAKQTKVARELKYRSVNTDFSSLERELRGGESAAIDDEDHTDDLPEPDPYADLAARYGDDDDEDDFPKYDGYGDLRKSS
jgi:hypothetical protein